MKTKRLKYRDAPWDVKRAIDSSGPLMQPRKSENPTIRHLIGRLEKSIERSIKAGASGCVARKRDSLARILRGLREANLIY